MEANKRISIALLSLHVLMFIALLPRNYCAKVINEACFVVKFLFVIGVSIALIFVENKYLKNYVHAAMILSIVFLLYQAVALIDFAYKANERMVREYHRGNNCYGVLLIFFSLSLLALNVLLLVEHFMSFWIDGSSLRFVFLLDLYSILLVWDWNSDWNWNWLLLLYIFVYTVLICRMRVREGESDRVNSHHGDNGDSGVAKIEP